MGSCSSKTTDTVKVDVAAQTSTSRSTATALTLTVAIPEVLSDTSSKVPSSWLRTSRSALLFVVTKYLKVLAGVLVRGHVEALRPAGEDGSVRNGRDQVRPPESGQRGNAAV